MSKFDIFFAGLVAMTLHPGYNRENAYPLSIEECAEMALEMVRISEKQSCLGS